MTILIDSAVISEVKTCSEKFPWVRGLSSNPKLLKIAAAEKTGREVTEILAGLTNGPFYYQATSSNEDELLKECHLAKDIVGDRLIVKIMPSDFNYRFSFKHHKKFNFSFTAVHNLAQAKLAFEAGAANIVIYVNRMLKNQLDPYRLIKDVGQLYPDDLMVILAASIKSIKEFEDTLTAGAQVLTLPFTLIKKLAHHDLTKFAADDFAKSGIGIL